MSNFYEQYKIFNKNQSGLLREKSTTNAMLEMIDFILGNFQEREDAIAIFLHLSKAFDYAQHENLENWST